MNFIMNVLSVITIFLLLSYGDTKPAPSNRDQVTDLNTADHGDVKSALQVLLDGLITHINSDPKITENPQITVVAGRLFQKALDIEGRHDDASIEKRGLVSGTFDTIIIQFDFRVD